MKYVIFLSDTEMKAVPKNVLTDSHVADLKCFGFRRYHIEVNASNEIDAIKKVKAEEKEQHHFLADISGSFAFYSALIGIPCLFFFVKSFF